MGLEGLGLTTKKHPNGFYIGVTEGADLMAGVN
jgi:hypothetical protein